MNFSRCLMHDTYIDRRCWPEVVRTTVYLKNRPFTKSTIECKTPYEIFLGKRPNLDNLKLHGSKVFVRVRVNKRNPKWDRKADVEF